MLAEESRRPTGPRGGGDKAKIDVEIERYLADRLTVLLPARFVGEETPIRPGDGSPFCWMVDPHEGTWAWLEGHRGSAVSVALLQDGVPVLGVVCAPMSPDRGRDLIAWAEGLPHLLRNGAEVRADLSRAALTAGGDRLLPPSYGDSANRVRDRRCAGALRQPAEHRLSAGARRGWRRRRHRLPERAGRHRLRRRSRLAAGRGRCAARRSGAGSHLQPGRREPCHAVFRRRAGGRPRVGRAIVAFCAAR